MNKVLKLALAAAVTLSATACSDNDNSKPSDGRPDAQETALKAVIGDYVDNTVVPTYRGLADATMALAETCDDMCRGGIENLTEAQIRKAGEQWIDARRYWELSEAWLFGAASDYNIDPHVDTWPLDKKAMDAMLGNPAQMAQMSDRESAGEYVGSSLGQGLLGFHAIEYMIFEPQSASATITSPRPVSRFTQNELYYLAAVADDLRNCCLRLEASWAPEGTVDAAKLAILDEAELSYDKNYGDYMKKAGSAGSTYVSYAEAVRSGAQIVINTTPAGMYPNVGVCNLDVAAMPGLEAVVDVVYNPDKTELILRAEEAGVPVTVGGLEMLVAQAVYAAEYFLDRKFEDAPAEIRRITAALRRDTLNIALIGMPSSGKTTLGKLLAKQLGRTFVDLDDAIVKADGRSIPDIFAAEGEDGFRAKETEQTARFGKENRQLLSCGGGVVKRPENLRALHQNGVVLFIDRPVEALAVGGSRPLSSSMEALRTMEAQRRPLYRAAADAVVPNTGTLEDALRAAMEALDEIFDS